MYIEHPKLTVPEDRTTIWRYMDFTKFVSLISKKALFFSSPALFRDVFEGSVTLLTRESRLADVKNFVDEIINRSHQESLKKLLMDKVNSQIAENVSKSIPQLLETNRHTLFVSCWHMNEYESAAM